MNPDPDCPYCGGTGDVVDWVPYGDTNVPMYAECECWQPDELDEQEFNLVLLYEGDLVKALSIDFDYEEVWDDEVLL